jgi:hypothetical protein
VNRFCPNCGAEVPEGAAFCPNCGQSLPQQPDRTQQPEPPSEPTTPPAQAGTPGGPQQPPAPPPEPPSFAPSGEGPRRGLFIGGCAVAGVLGILAVLVIGALVVFLAIGTGGTQADPGPKPNPGPTSQPTPQPTQEPTPQPTPQPEPSPDQGSLDSVIQRQVGDFRLEKVETIPKVIGNGATDARQMLYVSPDGVQILHILTAWSSADVANDQIQPFGQELESQGYDMVREFPLKNEDGQQVGTAQIFIGDGGEEVAIWTDDVLFCMVDAPKGYGADFFNELPY